MPISQEAKRDLLIDQYELSIELAQALTEQNTTV